VSFRWLTVFLDFPAGRLDAGVAFWRAVTGYGLSPWRGAQGEFATLLPPSGDAYLRVQRVSAGTGGCHLDLHVDRGRESLSAVTEQARAAGASIGHQEDGLSVARSPGGFPFCLVDWEEEHAVPAPLATAGGLSRVDTLCLDVPPGQFEQECAFWSALTGSETRPAPVPGYAILAGAPGWPVRLLLQRRDHADAGDRVRGHLDLGCTDPEAAARHINLSARALARQPHWTVLADPAGREYCLIDRPPR
jgi:Glyoxalase-like domain